tara:strand:- start:80 stop:322 length:243 start_codon:yes stop_codon:yes gene_type:complete
MFLNIKQKDLVFTLKTPLDHRLNLKRNIEAKEDNMKNWELSFGLFEGLLFGYRNYPDNENNKIDHVFYVFIFDICLTLKY